MIDGLMKDSRIRHAFLLSPVIPNTVSHSFESIFGVKLSMGWHDSHRKDEGNGLWTPRAILETG